MEKAFLICFFFNVNERSGARFAHARNTETFTTHTHSRGATVLVTALRPRYSGSPRPAVCSLQVALASHLKAFSFLSRKAYPSFSSSSASSGPPLRTCRGSRWRESAPRGAGRHCGRRRRSLPSAAARRGLSSRAQRAALSKRVGFWRGAGWAARADCEPVRCGRASARWPRGCGLDCNMC